MSRARPLRSLVAIACTGVFVTACKLPTFGTPTPATRQGRDILDLWQVFLVAALIVGGVVCVLIAWSIVRFRRKPAAEQADGAEPPQVRYNMPWEVAYTTAPILIVAALFVLTVRVQHRVDALVPAPDVTVEVTGFQWQWKFRYPIEDVTLVGTYDAPPVMVLPVGATVRLVLLTNDVHHSFYVPEFLFKRDLIVGHPNEVDLFVERAGTYQGFCAEFCGLDHDRMRFSVTAVSPDEYRAFLAAQK